MVYKAFWEKRFSADCSRELSELFLRALKDRKAFHKFIEKRLEGYDDLMKVTEVMEVIGYSDTSIHRWCRDKKLKAFYVSSKFFIPKVSLVDFLLSENSFDIKHKTNEHISLVRSFLENSAKK